MRTPLNARTAILLALDRPGYGLQIIDRVRHQSAGHIRLRLGSVYPALSRLERSRLVRSWEVPAPGRGRRRRYYELTGKGVAAARAEREALQGLMGAAVAGPSTEEIARMRQRLRECADVSAFVLDLGERMANRRRSGRRSDGTPA
jgi:PadR family transcriptional regulator PadR